MSARRCTSKPVTVPSFLAVSVMSWIWSRPWWAASSDSERVSVHLTGLPSFCATDDAEHLLGQHADLAAEAAADVRGDHAHLAPRAGPASTAVMVRRMCGIWVAA